MPICRCYCWIISSVAGVAVTVSRWNKEVCVVCSPVYTRRRGVQRPPPLWFSYERCRIDNLSTCALSVLQRTSLAGGGSLSLAFRVFCSLSYSRLSSV